MNVDEHVGNVWVFHHIFLSERQKLDKALEAGLRVKERKQGTAFFQMATAKESRIYSARYKSVWAKLLLSEENQSIYIYFLNHRIQLGLLDL